MYVKPFLFSTCCKNIIRNTAGSSRYCKRGGWKRERSGDVSSSHSTHTNTHAPPPTTHPSPSPCARVHTLSLHTCRFFLLLNKRIEPTHCATQTKRSCPLLRHVFKIVMILGHLYKFRMLVILICTSLG